MFEFNARNEGFNEFPFTQPLTPGTARKTVIFIEHPFFTAAISSVQSKFSHIVGSLHVASLRFKILVLDQPPPTRQARFQTHGV
jgi:hypothetical protein